MATDYHNRGPGPIKHGTVGGYQAHLERDRPPCEDCRAAASDSNTSSRVRGGQAGVTVPAEVIGSLLLAASNEATRRHATTAIGPKTATACVERATATDGEVPASPAQVQRE